MKEKCFNRMGNCRSDRHKTNQRKVKKNIVVKSMLFSSLVLGGMLLSNGHEVHASEWQANSPEAIRATLQENQSSYTFKEGDTFYNIGIAVNVKWQTLMTANNFELGSQYTVPVGTTISFDGSKMTVTDQSGKVLSETNLKTEDKVDSNQTFAGQKSDTPSKTKLAATSQKGKAALVKEKTQAEKQKEQLEAEKAQKEKEKEQLEAQKAQAEKELTEKLNAENGSSLASVKEKSIKLEADIEKQKTIIAQKQEELSAAQSRLDEAQATHNSAVESLSKAQEKVNESLTYSAKMDEVQVRVSTLQSQIAALRENNTDPEIAVKVAALEDQLLNAQEELGRYRIEVDKANRELSNAQAIFNAADQGLKQVEEYYASVQEGMKQDNADLVVLQEQLAEVNKNFPESAQAGSSKDANEIKKILADYDAKIDQINDELANLNVALEQVDQKIEEIDEALNNNIEFYVDFQGYSNDVLDYLGNHNPNQLLENAEQAIADTGQAMPDLEKSPNNVNKFIIKNIDKNHNELSSTLGYVRVSEITEVSVETLENGSTITTYTTILIWHKI